MAEYYDAGGNPISVPDDGTVIGGTYAEPPMTIGEPMPTHQAGQLEFQPLDAPGYEFIQPDGGEGQYIGGGSWKPAGGFVGVAPPMPDESLADQYERDDQRARNRGYDRAPRPGQIEAAPITPAGAPVAVPRGSRGVPVLGEATPSRGGLVGGYGSLRPISPQYYPWETMDQFAASYDAAEEQLKQKAFFDGTMTLDGYRKASEALKKDREVKGKEFGEYLGSLQGKIDTLQRTQVANANAQGEIEAQATDAQGWGENLAAAQMKDASKRYEASHAEFEERRARMEQRVEAEMDGYRKAAADLAATKIDPDRYWKSKGTAGQIGAGIAMALGTAGAIMTRRPNEVMDLINKQIDRDISAQMADLDTKKASVGAQESLVGMMRARLGDVDRAEAAAKAHIYAQLEQRMAITGATVKNKVTQKRAEALRLSFAQRKDELEKGLEIQAMARAKAEEQARAVALAGIAAARQKAISEEEMRRAGVAVWNESQVPKGWGWMEGLGFAVRGDMSKEAVEKLRANKEVITMIGGILGGGSKYNFSDRAVRESLLTQIGITKAKGEGMGAWDNGTKSAMDSILGDPNKFLADEDWAKKTLHTVQQNAEMNSANMAGSVGMVPAEMVWLPNKKGEMTPQYVVKGVVPGGNVAQPYSPTPVQSEPVK